MSKAAHILSEASLARNSARISKTAEKASKAILGRLEFLPWGKPLIVVAGEDHDIVAHPLCHLLTLNRLKDRAPLAVGMELSHNLRDLAFRKITGRPPSPATAAALRQADADGDVSLKSRLARHDLDIYAPAATGALLSFLLQNRLRTRFLDSATMQEQDAFETRDPSTASALHDLFGDAAKPRTMTSRRAIAARNLHMARMSRDFARETGARILFVSCGNTHVAGDRNGGTPARESLTWFLKQQGAEVLAMPAFNPEFDEKDFGRLAWLAPREKFPLRGLPHWSACYDPVSGSAESAEQADLRRPEQEQACVARILSGTGIAAASNPPERHAADLAALYMRRGFAF